MTNLVGLLLNCSKSSQTIPLRFLPTEKYPLFLGGISHSDWFLITQNLTTKLGRRAHKGTNDQRYATFRLKLTDKLPVTAPTGREIKLALSFTLFIISQKWPPCALWGSFGESLSHSTFKFITRRFLLYHKKPSVKRAFCLHLDYYATQRN